VNTYRIDHRGNTDETRLVSMSFAALLLLCSAVSFAGEFEDGLAAYNRGDYKTALAMFTKAANKGDATAQSNLGHLYYEGRGVPQDYNQAVLWHRKAADQGYAKAQYNLGLMYVYGQGVTQDYVEAHRWFNTSLAYSTDKEVRDNATKNRDIVARKMTPAQLAEAYKRTSEWKKK
jgi:tetratricopeptide (TPR) repeat protein